MFFFAFDFSVHPFVDYLQIFRKFIYLFFVSVMFSFCLFGLTFKSKLFLIVVGLYRGDRTGLITFTMLHAPCVPLCWLLRAAAWSRRSLGTEH